MHKIKCPVCGKEKFIVFYDESKQAVLRCADESCDSGFLFMLRFTKKGAAVGWYGMKVV